MLRFLAVFLWSFDKLDRSQLRILPSDTAQIAVLQLVIDRMESNDFSFSVGYRGLVSLSQF